MQWKNKLPPEARTNSSEGTIHSLRITNAFQKDEIEKLKKQLEWYRERYQKHVLRIG